MEIIEKGGENTPNKRPSFQENSKNPNLNTASLKKEKIKLLKNRVKTGIRGFDKLVQGGFPINASVLVVGGPGSGKTIFGTEYLVRGASVYKEKGLYVTFEQRADDLRKQARQFGWDLKNLENSGMLKIMSIPVESITKRTISEIKETVKKENIKRLVVDSLSTLVVNAPIYTNPSELSVEQAVGDNVIFSPPIIGDYVVKRFIYNFIEGLRDLKCTNLLIGEASQTGETLSRDTLSEFACDGVITITFESLGGEFSRSLIVRKMRRTKNNEDLHPMEIGKNGITVHDIAQ